MPMRWDREHVCAILTNRGSIVYALPPKRTRRKPNAAPLALPQVTWGGARAGLVLATHIRCTDNKTSYGPAVLQSNPSSARWLLQVFEHVGTSQEEAWNASIIKCYFEAG
jgi:hypothetical protein